MPEPLTIVTAILTLLATCVKTGWDIRTFREAKRIADDKIQGLLVEVQSSTEVLGLINDTPGHREIHASFQSTRIVGNHWTILLSCLQDGQTTLQQLQRTLDRVHKPVKWFDKSRQHLRIEGSASQIDVYQRQIRSYKDTLQLSLQTVLLWNQVTFQNSVLRRLELMLVSNARKPNRAGRMEAEQSLSETQGLPESRINQILPQQGKLQHERLLEPKKMPKIKSSRRPIAEEHEFHLLDSPPAACHSDIWAQVAAFKDVERGCAGRVMRSINAKIRDTDPDDSASIIGIYRYRLHKRRD